MTPRLKALAPLNGTDRTFRAVETAMGILTRIPGVEITFLVVISKPLRDMPADAREYLEYDDEDTLFIRDDEADAVLRKAEAIAKRLKVTSYRLHRAIGDVQQTILAEAAAHDVLVMHGLSPNPKAEKKRGSAAEAIVRASPCHVLLVNAP